MHRIGHCHGNSIHKLLHRDGPSQSLDDRAMPPAGHFHDTVACHGGAAKGHCSTMVMPGHSPWNCHGTLQGFPLTIDVHCFIFIFPQQQVRNLIQTHATCCDGVEILSILSIYTLVQAGVERTACIQRFSIGLILGAEAASFIIVVADSRFLYLSFSHLSYPLLKRILMGFPTVF